MPNEAIEYKKIPKSCACLQIYVYINMYKIAVKIVIYIIYLCILYIYQDIFCILILLDSPELSDIYSQFGQRITYFFSQILVFSKIYYF